MIENVIYDSKAISFIANLTKAQTVRINTIYYPGWQLSVDGVKAAINYNNQFGVMEINVPAGRHVVKGVFNETPLRLFSDLVSLLSVCGLLFYLIYNLSLKFKKT